MHLTIIISHSSGAVHQSDTAKALAAGCVQHGDRATIVRSGEGWPRDTDAFCIWGWRRGQPLHEKTRRPVLVMERAYLDDRFRWVSFGWNGLNGRAVHPVPRDGGERWRRHFEPLMKPWRATSAGYALVLGQVPTDTACRHIDFHLWARQTASALSRDGWRCVFRAHPKASGLRCGLDAAPGAVIYRNNGGLEEAFAGAAIAVTFNSNSGVDAVMAGVPTYVADRGSMAWDVASHDLAAPRITPDRTAWGTRISWCQWLPAELADGSAWEAVRSAIPQT